MLRPEGSDPSTIAGRCPSGSARRHRAAATPRRSRSGRTASGGGSTPRPAPSSRASATPTRRPRPIAREAGMSKATFYEHFDNKEDCILALFDERDGPCWRRCGAPATRRRATTRRARRARVIARLPRGARRVPGRGADAARRDHRRGPARDRAPRPRARRLRGLHRRRQPRATPSAAARRGFASPARRVRHRRRRGRARLAPDPHGPAGRHPRPRAGRRAPDARPADAAAAPA